MQVLLIAAQSFCCCCCCCCCCAESRTPQLRATTAIKLNCTTSTLMTQVDWKPLAGPDDDGTGAPPEIDDPEDVMGQPWTYRLSIKGATALPIMVSSCFVQYEFFGGETFTTETIEANTHSPRLDYTCTHHVARVTPAFVEWLKKPLQFWCVSQKKKNVETCGSRLTGRLKTNKMWTHVVPNRLVA